MKYIGIFLLLFSGTSYSNLPSEPRTILNFKLSPKGYILIPVLVNGKHELKFLFDTGAGKTALNKASIPKGLLEKSNPEEVLVNRVHESEKTFQQILDSIEVSGIISKNISVVLMDLSDVESSDYIQEGILGHNFFGSYDLEIDYINKQIKFYDQVEKCHLIGESFELFNGTHIKFPLNLGDVKVPAILDTGSPYTGINSYAADALLPGVSEQLLKAKATHPMSSPHGHSEFYFGRLSIGSVSLGESLLAEQHVTNVVNLPVFKSFKLASSPGALVGADLLTNRSIFISYSCKKLVIK